ncbi:zinc finger C2H2-type protein [Fadolivirus algeromassiliense]|jgi:hypothetical protein|uniref:Zinc finger C2H2-type protein n=1 Tax=Fadolivirus FV1/VV64 TaxID=3070911 RepID=A0A7D3QXC6_9VIRU|nr:zinc finger C2H2-type protein [Fadolivirus algeromassiliense]QKF94360.1 zinc finger C2H2-type protein [Fadolivirus FV1/VV64]
METKFNCDQCGFHTNYESKWKAHCETELHKTGKRKTRSDKKLLDKCSFCDYKATNNTTLKQHVLNHHSSKEERKSQFTYYCEYCDCGTFAKPLHENHLKSKKHLRFLSYNKKQE